MTTDLPNIAPRDKAEILARVQGKAMIAIASWAPQATSVPLQIDWKALGIDPAKATITASAIEGFQPARTFKRDEAIPLEPGKGWLLTWLKACCATLGRRVAPHTLLLAMPSAYH